MTLVERLINEHNQVVQYAEESPKKDGFLSGMKKAIDIVKNHNGWISVDDDLPKIESKKDYLAYSTSTKVYEKVDAKKLRIMIDNSAKITHWQHLLSPPKE